ncbi:MAG: GNAT family N-acetyltransferase [Rhodobacteraceae bacterium]|nr:GNAT family N-acetyltransferase [Paracoccaceae bacterium]
MHSPKRTLSLPSGRTLHPTKPRFAGTLDSEEIAFCRDNGIALAFDPVQQGWVTLDCEDDLRLAHVRHVEDRKTREEATSRFTFRRWRPDDLPAYLALLDDPDVWAYLPEAYPDPLDEDTARVLIEISASQGHHDVCAVEHDGQVVGQARLAFPEKSRDRDSAEISYWLGQAHWGRGLGSDIVALFTDRAFCTWLSLRELYALVHADNAASARVLEKAGYRHSGQSRKDPSLRIFRIARADRAV